MPVKITLENSLERKGVCIRKTITSVEEDQL
jgi:hypothetical protein